jgi:hypothetical protein
MSNNIHASLSNLPPISWGVLVIFMCLFIIGLIFFKRRVPKHRNLQQKALEQKLQTLKTAISVMGPITDSVNKMKKNDNLDKNIVAGWEIPIFFRQVRAIFIEINKCIFDNNLKKLKAFCDLEAYQAILQSNTSKKRKIINSSLEIKFLEHKKINGLDIISVKISGDYLNYNQPEEILSAKIEESFKIDTENNSKKNQSFSEVWNFVLQTIPQDMVPDFKLQRWLFAGNHEFKQSHYDSQTNQANLEPAAV